MKSHDEISHMEAQADQRQQEVNALVRERIKEVKPLCFWCEHPLEIAYTQNDGMDILCVPCTCREG